jgi:hypothetical protein
VLTLSSPFGHAALNPPSSFLVNTGTYRAGSCALIGME